MIAMFLDLNVLPCFYRYNHVPAGGEGEGTWLLPDVLVNVLRGGDDGHGVVREVLGVRVAHRMVDSKILFFVSCHCLYALKLTGWILPSCTWVVGQR